jgi:hypothetical protein
LDRRRSPGFRSDPDARSGLSRHRDGGPPAQAQQIIGYLILAQAIFGAAFAWVYVQGKEDKPWLMQGIRFGIAVACLTVIPTYLIYHVVTPVPLALAIKQIVLDTIRMLLMGVVLAWINR